MRIKMGPGDVLAVDLPGNNEIQIEAYTDHVTAQVGPQIIFSASEDIYTKSKGLEWRRNVPPPLVTEVRPEGPNIARELKPGESQSIMTSIASKITNTAWWAEKNGWPIHYVDADGSRVYKKPIESNTDWTLCVRIYPNGQKAVSIEGIKG